MAITSTVFIMFFLPVSLGIYYFSRDSVKEYVLLIISLLFYACGSLQFLMLFIVSAFITVCLGRMMAEHREKRRVALFLMVIGVVWNTAILCYYKYLDFGLTIFAQISKIDVTLRNLALPMGISFFTFKAISYLVDIYKGTASLRIVQFTICYTYLFLPKFSRDHCPDTMKWEAIFGNKIKANTLSLNICLQDCIDS